MKASIALLSTGHDPQRFAFIRPVRTGIYRRTDPRQDRRLLEEGHVDGR